jgi:hypothetical protein
MTNSYEKNKRDRHFFPAGAEAFSLNLSSDRNALAGFLSVLLALWLASAGCATKVKSEWKDETFQPGQLRNVLVIAAARSDTIRRFGESEFVKQLQRRGIKAVESITLIPEGGIDAPGFRENIIAKIKEQGIDAVLIARSLGSTTKTESSQATYMYTAPYATYDAWYSYYSIGPDFPWAYPSASPSSATGISYDRTYVTMETSLYDARTEKLVWSLRTDTQVVGLPEEEIKPYVDFVVRKLLGARLF